MPGPTSDHTADAAHLPLVSVVIPTHNRADLVLRAIRSVLAQTYKNLECIVVDDASTDNTEGAVRAIHDPRLIYLRHEQSKHASAARNTGIAAAKGEFVAFLDDDDEWLPQKLAKQVTLLHSLPADVGMVYCWMEYLRGAERMSLRRPTLRGHIFGDVLDEQRIGNSSTLLVRRAVTTQIRGFDESLPRGNDGDFIRRVCRSYAVDVVPEVLVNVYVDHGFNRITGVDERSIRNAILSQEDKLTKFRDDLAGYPRQASNIYAILGDQYAQLRDYRKALSWFLKAIATYPLSSSLYMRMLRSAKRMVIPRRDTEVVN